VVVVGKMIAISTLTNADRLPYLQLCIESFLDNCRYRPIVWAIYDNGSTDDTWQWLQSLKNTKDVQWRIDRSEEDLGVGPGINRANRLIEDFEYSMFLESDWIHMPQYESGVSKNWLKESLEFMKQQNCDYLYLRRFRNENEMMYHWWSQWMPRCSNLIDNKYMQCKSFWYSNNPHLRNYRALKANKTLPLPEYFDESGNPLEKKGNEQWSQAEMNTPKPSNPYIYKWGMFAHERVINGAEYPNECGCGSYGGYGTSGCKYGFYKQKKSLWCRLCDAGTGFDDMPHHENRYRKVFNDPNKLDEMRNKLSMPCV